jgi:hypothetical protein
LWNILNILPYHILLRVYNAGRVKPTTVVEFYAAMWTLAPECLKTMRIQEAGNQCTVVEYVSFQGLASALAV